MFRLSSTALLAALAVGGVQAPAQAQDLEDLRGSIKVDGSSTVYPITEAVAEEFAEVAPRVRVTVGISGTGGGFKRFTAGETDVGNILRNVERANDAGVRVFVFGVGYDVNTTLLDKLSGGNHGTVTYVKPEEDIEIKVSNFYAKLSRPVLSDISLDFGEARVSDVYPKELPDLFDGSQVVVFGRYEGSGSTTVTMTGTSGDGELSFAYDAKFSGRGGRRAGEIIPRLWASRKIAYLIEQIRLHGNDRELIDEVIELSIAHGIVTPYTSYLILEDDRWDHVPRTVREQASSMAPQAQSVGRAMKSEIGYDAVSLSSKIAEDKDRSVVDEPPGHGVAHVGGKTFYLSDGVWIDSEYDEKSDSVDIEFLGDAYFDLIERYPAVAGYLAMGTQVVFVHEGVSYRIVAD